MIIGQSLSLAAKADADITISPSPKSWSALLQSGLNSLQSIQLMQAFIPA